MTKFNLELECQKALLKCEKKIYIKYVQAVTHMIEMQKPEIKTVEFEATDTHDCYTVKTENSVSYFNFGRYFRSELE